MADHFEVVKDAPGFGNRIVDSIKGIFVGIIIFAAAFPLLWWGENRQNLAEFVEKAQMVVSTAAPVAAPATLVKTTGVLTTPETLGDPTYLMGLGATKAMVLKRNVEMYAWKEKKETKKKGDKEVTTYDYEKTWTSSPEKSSEFYDANGHVNPTMTEQDASYQVSSAKVGMLNFDAAKTEFWDLKKYSVKQEMLNSGATKPLQVTAGDIYIPYDNNPSRGVASMPIVGDLRISYTTFPADVNGSVVGDWDGSQIAPHVYDETDTFLGAYAGGLKEFQAYLQSRHNMITWVIRIASLFMMWMGLNMILGPVLTVLDSIPIVGGAGKAVISLVTGAIAFVLWFLTLVLANLWLVLLVLAGLGAGFIFYNKKQKAQTFTQAA